MSKMCVNKRYKSLKKGNVNVVAADASAVDLANDEKRVHLTGKVQTKILTDDGFVLSVNAIQLA